MSVEAAAGTVTRLLAQIQAGDDSAQSELFEVVHSEIRSIASGFMAKERAGHSMQPSDLVNEAVGRLLQAGVAQVAKSRSYFFGALGRAMRQVLVDHARKRSAEKRGGAYERVPLDDALDQIAEQKVDVLDLNDTLEELEQLYPRQAHVVSLRFFGGMTNKEVGEQLGVSETTVENDFRAARAFLHSRLAGEEDS